MLSSFCRNLIKINSNHTFVFFFYCYMLYLPLPLGSNRPWFWSFSHLCIYSLLFAYGVLNWEQVKKIVTEFKLPLAVFFTLVIWLVLQWVPMPINIVSIISPNSAHAYSPFESNIASISLDPKGTLSSLLKVFNYLAVFILGLLIINSPERIKTTLVAIIVSGTINGFYGAFEILSGQDFSLLFGIEAGHRASGTFDYHNHFANYLMLCLSAGLGYFVASLTSQHYPTKGSHAKSWLFAVLEPKTAVRLGLTIMVIALVMSHSRMGNTAFFLSLSGVSLLYIIIGRNVPNGFKLLIISMLIIDVFVVSAWFGLDKVKERLEATSIEQETRDEVVMDGLKIVQDYPLTGSGAGSFRAAFSSYQSEDVRLTYKRAHNDYLQFAIEYGIPILVLLGCFIINLIRTCIKVIYRVQDKRVVGGAVAALMAISGMLIHMSVDFPLLSHANATYFVLLLSVAYCSSRYIPREN